MCSTLSLRSFPNIALEMVPIFVWLMIALALSSFQGRRTSAPSFNACMNTLSPVAAVRKRCDDKTAWVAQVLVGVGHGGGDHAHHDQVLLKVVAQLADPGEVVRGLSQLVVQRADHITGCKITQSQCLPAVQHADDAASCNATYYTGNIHVSWVSQHS